MLTLNFSLPFDLFPPLLCTVCLYYTFARPPRGRNNCSIIKSVLSFWPQSCNSLEDNIPFAVLEGIAVTHYLSVCAGISGELYVQCQQITSLKDRDGYTTD